MEAGDGIERARAPPLRLEEVHRRGVQERLPHGVAPLDILHGGGLVELAQRIDDLRGEKRRLRLLLPLARRTRRLLGDPLRETRDGRERDEGLEVRQVALAGPPPPA